jgi:hypothetical protein
MRAYGQAPSEQNDRGSPGSSRRSRRTESWGGKRDGASFTCYLAKRRETCRSSQRDAELKEHIRRVYEESYGVYEARKIRRQLKHEGVDVARCSNERLMRQMGMAGRTSRRRGRITIPADASSRSADLVDRTFRASAATGSRSPTSPWSRGPAAPTSPSSPTSSAGESRLEHLAIRP